MDTRGAGLAALLLAGAVALLSACGGSAFASAPAPAPTTSAAVDVEGVALDEVSALGELGYPTELVAWVFEDDFVNANGGTAWASADSAGYTTVTISTNPAGYLKFGDDVEASVRSTVRHEFGHALTYWLYPTGPEQALSASCPDSNGRTIATGVPVGECAAEAISALLSHHRGDERVPFYDLELSRTSIDALRPTLEGSLSWAVPAA